MTILTKKHPLAFAVAIAGLSSLPALAEEQAPALELEEVVVTAQKKAEPLQDTPIAISAFTSNSLEKLAITEVTDLRGQVPSLSVAPFAATRVAPVVFLRGIGNIDIQSTIDNAVGIYIDGVNLGRASGLATEIADLERIEVLRGPQGALYGRNTTGGAINFITKKPDTEGYHFKQQITVGNYDLAKSITSANLAFTDNFAATASYLMTQQDGWVENDSAGSNQVDFYEDDSDAGRVALRFKATDQLTFDYAYDFSNLEYGNGYYQRTKDTSGAGWYPDSDEDRLDQAIHHLDANTFLPVDPVLEPSESEVDGHNLTIEYTTGSLVLRSITSFRELEDDLFQNYNNLFIQTNQQEQEQVSQEFQAVGTLGERFEYVAGLYYFSEEASEHQVSIIPSIAFPAPFNQDEWSVESESESVAIYANGTYTPPILDDHMKITLGLRHTRDERKAEKTFINVFGTTNIGTFEGDKDFSKTNPSLTINYLVNNDITTYAKVSTGYRAGGFATRATAAQFQNGFDEENVTSTEIGFKSDLANKRVRLNAAIFNSQYEDLQISQKRTPEIFTDIINAGEATVNGVEIEMSALLAQGLTLDFFYAYLDAEFDEFYDDPDQNGILDELSDVREVPYAPENSTKLALTYELPVSYGSYSFGVDYYWQDETYSAPFLEDLNDSYGIWNSRIELSNINVGTGMLRFGLWGKNLADEEYTVITTNFASAGFTSSMFGTPRTYGLDAIYEF